MLVRKKLSGRRVAVLAADGFEQVELTIPRKALLAAGAEVEIISLRPGKIRGMNLDQPGKTVAVDKTFAEAEPAHYDALFLPGGFINPDLLRQSREARSFVRAMEGAKKPIAVICHGPWLLASAELLPGRQLTSWSGIRDDLVHAGAVWRDEPVVLDGNWLSSRGPQDLVPFTSAMLDHFAEFAPLVSTTDAWSMSPAMSDPQREEPPPLAVIGAAALPKVARLGRWLGAAAAFAAGGAALLALRRAMS